MPLLLTLRGASRGKTQPFMEEEMPEEVWEELVFSLLAILNEIICRFLVFFELDWVGLLFLCIMLQLMDVVEKLTLRKGGALNSSAYN